jgi:hypothetical protein
VFTTLYGSLLYMALNWIFFNRKGIVVEVVVVGGGAVGRPGW